MDLLIPCLRSLAALADTPSHEVVVIANGTPETALATLPSQESLVVVISSLNLGFGGGCNWGRDSPVGGAWSSSTTTPWWSLTGFGP
jgi:GT2 family glycosyltransferase